MPCVLGLCRNPSLLAPSGASLYEQIALARIQPVLNNWKTVMHTVNTTESSFSPSKLTRALPPRAGGFGISLGCTLHFPNFLNNVLRDLSICTAKRNERRNGSAGSLMPGTDRPGGAVGVFT